MKFKDFIQEFTENAKDYIEKYEQYKDLTGEQKKARVDDIILAYCENALDNLPLNFVFKWALRKILIPNIPHITQAIFDLLKAKVEGVTK